MRNIFDQYSQPENRVTHALMTALNEDRKLLGFFLRELIKVKAPTDARKLRVLEQRYPGEEEEELSEDDLERQGIPDGWIYDDEGWCVFIETKVKAKLTVDQIYRHRKTAERRGFQNITAAAIAPVVPASTPTDTVLLEWRMVYEWLRRHSPDSEWAARAAHYLEITEAKLLHTQQFEGTLTMFSGFPFGRDHPFNYVEGKRILKLARDELVGHPDLKRLGVTNAPGRGAIKGRKGDGVWDFLWLSADSTENSFTKHSHLTLGIGSQDVSAFVIVPNAVNNTTKKKLAELGQDKFETLTEEIVENFEKNLRPLLSDPEGAAPWCTGLQRRWRSRAAPSFLDASIEFDLRTAIPSSVAPKTQPLWLAAAYGAFAKKDGSNYTLQMGVKFRYDYCPEIRKANAIDLIAKAWLACKPLIDLAR